MRSPTFLFFAFLLSCGTLTARAQETTTPAAPEPAATLEVQAELGGGTMWATPTDARNDVPGIEPGVMTSMGLGATLSIRHHATGIGLTVGYTHAFAGLLDHTGFHMGDARLSERLAFFHDTRVELSLLLEVGAVYAGAGGETSCALSLSATCTTRHVSGTLAGAMGVLGIEIRHGALLAGIEADYRHLDRLDGDVAFQQEIFVLGRIGAAIDL